MIHVGASVGGYTVVSVTALDDHDVVIVASRQKEYVVACMGMGDKEWRQGFYTPSIERAWSKVTDIVLG